MSSVQGPPVHGGPFSSASSSWVRKVTVFPLCHAGHLDAEWIYLIDPGAAAIALHTGGDTRVDSYRLAGCLTRPAWTAVHSCSAIPAARG
ncbi:hypothetical protein [Micromonospora sp. NBC_00858]|uniref:hypothetical protein n=1 Tax=Micromonospora sp. NBC_00858 TaxID=2975979 RepID=UPI003866FB65|nr:hypothetical protein OG990_15310 [Micromonospora sp. NBC_00858]